VRGRLIFPVIAELRPFSGAVVEDPDFKEPMRQAVGDDDGAGQALATCGPSISLPCQVEPDEVAALNMQPNGDTPRSHVHLVFHQGDLAGKPAPKVRDRLMCLRSKRGAVLADFGAAGGLIAVEARPLSFGLSRGNSVANLLRVTFRDRSQGVRRGA
jgi:hypothetical protein